jgi:hypothetical protein
MRHRSTRWQVPAQWLKWLLSFAHAVPPCVGCGGAVVPAERGSILLPLEAPCQGGRASDFAEGREAIREATQGI